MKKAIVVVVALLVVLLGLPAALGMRTESLVREHIATMDENPMFALNVESYDRGWFASVARVGVGLDRSYIESMSGGGGNAPDPLLAAAVADMSLTVVLDIDHGPIVVEDGFFAGLARFVARLNEESEVVAELQNRLAMPYLLEMRGRIGFTGVFRYDADVPPIDYADESGEFAFSGAVFNGSFDDGRLITNGAIDSIDFNAQAGSATIRGIRLAGDNVLVSSYVTIGTIELLVDRMIVTDAFAGPDPVLDASNLRVASDASLDDTGSLMDVSINYSADSVSAGSNDELELTDAELGLHVTKLDTGLIGGYYDALVAAGNDVEDPAVRQALIELVSQALERAPSVSIDPLEFRFFGEPFDARLEIRVDADAAQGGVDFTDVAALTTLFEASGNATASKTLADRITTEIIKSQLAATMSANQLPQGQDVERIAQTQAQLVLATLLGQGMIVSDGDNYTTMIEFANGDLKINGNSLPLGLL